MTRVKICGITRIEDAQAAIDVGAWGLGFVFHKKSPRCISPSKARTIVESLPPFITPVGIFVDHSEHAVRDICRLTRISTVQFHGDESPGYCKRFKNFKIIKAFRVTNFFNFNSAKQYKVDAYLFDAFSEDAVGGTGQVFNWELLKPYKFEKPIILSGGLNPENIQQAIETIHPFGVDVSSGVEKSPGIKDYKLMKLLCLRSFNFISIPPKQ